MIIAMNTGTQLEGHSFALFNKPKVFLSLGSLSLLAAQIFGYFAGHIFGYLSDQIFGHLPGQLLVIQLASFLLFIWPAHELA